MSENKKVGKAEFSAFPLLYGGKIMKLIDAVSNGYLDRVMKLYDSAFPADEKKPWQMMLDKRREGILSIMAAVDGEKLLGEAIWFTKGDIVLLDYLAVSLDCRGRGVGSEILKLVSELFPGKRIVLEIESTFISAPNALQRTKRKEFYIRAGMTPESYRVLLFDVEMEIMVFGSIRPSFNNG